MAVSWQTILALMHTSSHFLRYWALKELRSFDESSKQLVKIYFFKKHYYLGNDHGNHFDIIRFSSFRTWTLASLSVEVQLIPHEAANGAQQGLFLIVLLLLLLFVSYSFPWVNEISANKRPPVSSPLAAMQVEIRHMKMRSGGINFYCISIWINHAFKLLIDRHNMPSHCVTAWSYPTNENRIQWSLRTQH